MRLYNTLTRKIEELTFQKENFITFYSCGFTTYDYAHIGHGRKYISDDILKRTLTYLGFEVKHVQNVTDVGHLVSDGDEGEDKLEKGARKYGKTVWEVAEFYRKDFEKSMRLLNIFSPSILSPATKHIPQMIDLIKRLEKKGFTYETAEAMYFDTSKFKEYGRLSGQRLEDKIQKAREEVVVDPQKKHPADFVLWFRRVGRFKEHAMHWDSPWGDGFPGWHIECSAMSMYYLGDTIDIHSGGIDLIPVHHENEIAQSEAATGKKFVRYWFHTHFLKVEGVKMSKSLENFYAVSDLVNKGFNPLSFRYLCFQTHYRKTLNFTFDALTASQSILNKLYDTVRQLRTQNERTQLSEEKLSQVNDFRNQFRVAIGSDLQIPQALAVMHEALKSNIPSTDKLDLLYEFDAVLGLDLRNVEEVQIPSEITKLAKKRQQAKEDKNFEKADKIRVEIKNQGYAIEDTPQGFVIKKN